jgi:hypothetical protein
MTADYTIYDEIRILGKLTEKYGSKLPLGHLADLKGYLAVGENEMSFEYLLLEILERGFALGVGEKDEILKLGYHLKMDENDWMDEQFWEKFTEYLSAQPD